MHRVREAPRASTRGSACGGATPTGSPTPRTWWTRWCGHVLAWPRELDVDAMNGAVARLTGEHDFAAFCKRREGATTIRTLLDLSWARDTRGLAVATVRADAFCHNMVRSLVGCMIAVGEGAASPAGPTTSWPGASAMGSDGGARARADPRGGRLPGRRRGSPRRRLAARVVRTPSAAQPADPRPAGRGAHGWMTTTSPTRGAVPSAPVAASVWGRDLELTSGSGVFAQGQASTSAPQRCSGDHPAYPVRAVLDLGCGYGVIGLAVAACVPTPGCGRSTSTSGRCCWPTRTPPPSGSPTGTPRSPPTRCRWTWPRRDLVQPADPGRQAGPARAAAHLAAPATPGDAVMVVGKNSARTRSAAGEQGYPTERVASAKGSVPETRRGR